MALVFFGITQRLVAPELKKRHQRVLRVLGFMHLPNSHNPGMPNNPHCRRNTMYNQNCRNQGMWVVGVVVVGVVFVVCASLLFEIF